MNPDTTKDLMMNPGDRILIHMHDTRAGFQVNLVDLSTGQAGSMTASIANGFGHILYTPNSTTCQEAPYAFHPEYSTANTRGNTWSAHTYNVAMSDEVGHFENCLAIDAAFNCTEPGSQDAGGLDEDDGNNFCVPGTDSTLVMIDGCFSADEDWDSQAYQPDWARTRTRPWTARCIRRPSTSRVRSPSGGRTTRRSHSRPTCPISRAPRRRTTRRSATSIRPRIASTHPTGRRSTRSSRPGYTTAPASGRRAAT